MKDLNSIMFYKAKFDISLINGNFDLLWKIILYIRKWQTEKWNKDCVIIDPTLKCWTNLKTGGRLFSLDNSNAVFIESEYFAPDRESEYWACKIVEKRAPKQGYCLRQWVTEIGFEKNKGADATFSCVLSYSDIPGFIGPCEDVPKPTLPKIIKMIIEDTSIRCHIGEDNLAVYAQKLLPGSFLEFWGKVASIQREMPYIYISPKRKDIDLEDTFLLIDPQKLAEAVCANALVFYSESLDFSREMSFYCDEDYSCYSGFVRVYMPNVDVGNKEDTYRHRYITPTYISEVGADETIRMFRRALAQNVNFYESFFRTENCRQMKEDDIRNKRLLEIRTQHSKEMNEMADQKFDEAIEEEQKRLEAEASLNVLKEELKNVKTDNYNLSTQIENLRFSANIYTELENAYKSRFVIKRRPEKIADIIDYFTFIFKDRIAFSDDAIKSSKYCTFPENEFWEVLFHLATTMHDLFANGSPTPFKDFKEKTGWDCARSEGSMTRKDKSLMKQFQTKYNDRTIDIEPHITFPRIGQSIHFGFDDNSQKIIIGHCGEHLVIYSTQKSRR